MLSKTRKALLIALASLIIGQVGGYCLLSTPVVTDTIIPFLPAPANCELVTMDTQAGFTHGQQAVLDNSLRAKYSEVYQSFEAVPDSTWHRGPTVCEVTWKRTASGIFWFKSSFSISKDDLRSEVDETFVWMLFKWVSINEQLDAQRLEILFDAA
jgi:hypothetical protein